jgi:hypothetical protein
MQERGLLAWGAIVLAIVACGSETKNEDDPASSSGTPGPGFGDGGDDGGGPKPCAKDEDCGTGGHCNLATKTCGCGGQNVAADIVPPNLLIVLDRSCSMTDKVGATTKWDIAVAAIKDLLATNKGKIHFGLEVFPDKTGDQCVQDAPITVPVSPTADATIDSLLGAALVKGDANFPDGPCVTNIDTAMTKAQTEPSFADKTRKSYVILLTDGMQSGCNAGGGDTGTVTAITTLHGGGIDTFVIGFGDGVDKLQMTNFANAGFQPNPKGPPTYYDAADKPSLDAAFATIASQALSCTLKLASPPPGGDPSLLYVFVDKDPTPVPRNVTHGDHWDYDAASQTVTFYGADCDALKSGQTQNVSVVFGCPGGPVPTNPVK